MKLLLMPTSLAALAIAIASPAIAAQAPSPTAPSDPAAASPLPFEEELALEARQTGEIIVIADRIRGQVDAPDKPIQTLNEEDIASYGATSITDLLAALAPQTGSGRGRGAAGGMPVMLLNGQRVSSFREMRGIPPEAIKRVEILPEEVALRYGYSADQRVVNMILKDRFAAKTIEVEYEQPDRGGSSTNQLEATLFSVSGQGRLNLRGARDRTTSLTEAERGVIQTAGSVPTVATDPDPAAARTLIANRTNATLDAIWSTGFGPKGLDGSLTVNATVGRSDSQSLSGLNTVRLTGPSPGFPSAIRTFGSPLRRDNQTVTMQGGGTLNKQFGDWKFTGTVDAGRITSDTRIDRRVNASSLVAAASAGTLAINGSLPALTSAGSDRAYSATNTLNSLLTMVGRPVRLPAGDAALTLRAGYNHSGITSEDTRSVAGRTVLSRNTFSGGFNIGLPITSRRDNVLGAIGTLSLNFSAGIDQLSDFGALVDWSAGFNWGVTDKLSLQASWIVNEKAPDLASLGNPLAVSFNVPIYDFVRGETVLITVTSGGNPALLKQRDRDLKLGINWQVPGLKGSNLIVEYFRNNSDNVTASFPVLTPDIEAAFPGRVTRDSAGRLTALDRRAVTFANESASRLRWGLNVSGTIGKPSAMEAAMRRNGGGPPMGGPRMGGGGGPPIGAMMGPPGGQGRWNISAYHTVQFNNRVLIRQGGTVLDLLGGDALSGGGIARHSVELEGGAFKNGIGLRVNGTISAATKVNGTGAPGSSDLRFGGLAKINLRLFVDLGQQKWLAKKSKFLKGARFQLSVDNLLDSRQKVTDKNGLVPISYQPDLLDPQGRFLGIEFRKQF